MLADDCFRANSQQILVDEHLFLCEKTFRQLVSPLYRFVLSFFWSQESDVPKSITKASLICISTQSEKAGELTEMLTRKDRHGRMVVRCFRYSAVCPSCIAKGKKKECPHQAHRLPPWQSLEKMDQLAIMFAGNEDDLDREILGITVESKDTVFPEYLVNELFSIPRARFTDYVKRVFVSVDPNAGTVSSPRKQLNTDVSQANTTRGSRGARISPWSRFSR